METRQEIDVSVEKVYCIGRHSKRHYDIVNIRSSLDAFPSLLRSFDYLLLSRCKLNVDL